MQAGPSPLAHVKVAQAVSRDVSAVTHESYESMGYSRGASALGVALGLGELQLAQVTDEAVLGDWTLYSSRASASAGIELQCNVVIVLGEAAGSASGLMVRTGGVRLTLPSPRPGIHTAASSSQTAR